MKWLNNPLYWLLFFCGLIIIGGLSTWIPAYIGSRLTWDMVISYLAFGLGAVIVLIFITGCAYIWQGHRKYKGRE
jgi:hypothetical protein